MTDNDTGAAWRTAGERFVALGASLKAHYEEQREGRTAEGGDAAEDLGDAARRFAGAIGDAVDAVGAAARNPDVTKETRETGAAVADALGATFADVAEQLRRLAEGTRGGTSAATGTDDAPEGERGHGEEDDGGDDGPSPRLEPWGTP